MAKQEKRIADDLARHEKSDEKKEDKNNKYLGKILKLEKKADRYSNFEQVLTVHERNDQQVAQNLTSKSNGFGVGIPGIDQMIGLVLLGFLYKKHQVGELAKINTVDTIQTLIGLAGSKGVKINSIEAEILCQQALDIFNRSEDRHYQRAYTSGALGAVGGMLGGMALGGLAQSGPAMAGGAVAGAISGGILGYKLYNKIVPLLSKTEYHGRVDTFLDELKKTAEESHRKKLEYSDYNPDSNKETMKMVGTAAGGLAATLIGREFMNSINNKNEYVGRRSTVERFMRDNKDMNVTLDRAEALREANKIKSPTLRRVVVKTISENRTPYYFPMKSLGAGKNFISDHPNPGVTMHELGHAKDLKNSSAARQGLARLGALVGGGYLMHKGFTEEDKEYMVPLGTITTMSPTLRAEATANYHGYQGLKKYEGSESANKFLKKIVSRNTASYWSVPLVAGAIGYLGAKYHNHRLKDSKKNGKPIALREEIDTLKDKVGYTD